MESVAGLLLRAAAMINVMNNRALPDPIVTWHRFVKNVFLYSHNLWHMHFWRASYRTINENRKICGDRLCMLFSVLRYCMSKKGTCCDIFFRCVLCACMRVLKVVTRAKTQTRRALVKFFRKLKNCRSEQVFSWAENGQTLPRVHA